ncbi:hypothetical protein TELCIR_17727 [Teladorsagia circumcincta]|uniref:Uncharacterized protein n=1 Tax=Teladorsagia circumcincta TaxID=45464 RepID=A0A2G9TRZ3_TELCI|nr:hypothetical protein TELCIR_17727 [Teladorsagia circumcincta]
MTPHPSYYTGYSDHYRDLHHSHYPTSTSRRAFTHCTRRCYVISGSVVKSADSNHTVGLRMDRCSSAQRTKIFPCATM